QEVMQYVSAKYGRDRAALAATLITYRPKSAVRDVGKALGLDLAQVDRLARAFARGGGRDGSRGYSRGGTAAKGRTSVFAKRASRPTTRSSCGSLPSRTS